MKKCNACKLDKPTECFAFRSKAKGYLQSNCRDCQSKAFNDYRLNNLTERAEAMKEYRAENNSQINAWERSYRKAHYASNKAVRVRALVRRNKRRAKEAAATIKGFEKDIKNIYANCPAGFHVDHIIPLSHPLVCGLHVPWNLQYLPAEENLKKSNKIQELTYE